MPHASIGQPKHVVWAGRVPAHTTLARDLQTPPRLDTYTNPWTMKR